MTIVWQSFIPIKTYCLNNIVYLISIEHMENRQGRVDLYTENRYLDKNGKNSGLKSCLTYGFDNYFTN